MASAVRAHLTVDTSPPPAPVSRPPSSKESAGRPVSATSDPETAAHVVVEVDKDVVTAVDHVLRRDHHGVVDLRRVITAIWTRRADKAFTFELCARLPHLSLARRTLDQAEFYLPQLAHMIIHFDKELPVEPLGQFVLLLTQSSVHLALQFFWMVYVTLDENRPKRGGANPRTFARCAQLLLALEQCVVYGTLAAHKASDLLNHHHISKGEMKQLVIADRCFFAVQNADETVEAPVMSASSSPQPAPTKELRSSGWLLKKGGGTSTMGRRNWTLRWCRIENRILLVFNKPLDVYPRTAVPIAGAEVVVAENPKHLHYFEIVHSLSETRARFAAQSPQELVEWIDALTRNASAPEPPAGTSPVKAPGSPTRAISRMSVAMRSFLIETSATTVSSVNGTATGESPVTLSTNNPPSTTSAEGCGASDPPQTVVHEREASVEPVHESDRLKTEGDGRFDDAEAQQQATRSEFFSGMIHFVKAVTDVSEALRRAEPTKRKAMLQPLLEKIKVPPRAYIPLCKSTDPYCPVHAILRTEGRVFNTNERAPCLLYFETIENDDGLSVAQALFRYLYSPRDIVDDEGAEDLGDGQVDNGEDAEATETDASVSGTTTLHHSFSHAVPLESSAFVSELLADESRRQRLELVFGELSYSATGRLRASSDCERKATPQWRLSTLIAKSFDDLRQEVLVMQLLSFFQQIFQQEGLPLWLRPYRILSTGASTGLIEVIQNATSLDSIKKTPGFRNLRALFDQVYGGEKGEGHGEAAASDGGEKADEAPLRRQAELNFVHSLAAYSIVCYILAVKDRHNGNIMLDVEGHIIHIDFGFFLGRAPGGSFSFETAPFKLTAEMVEVLGGRASADFEYFFDLCVRGALAVRKHAETLYVLVETMSTHSKMPCFVGGAAAPLAGLRERLFLNMPEDKVRPAVKSMIQRAYDHFGTTKYDQFQVYSNGIAK